MFSRQVLITCASVHVGLIAIGVLMFAISETPSEICKKHIHHYAKVTHLKINPPYALEQVVHLFKDKLTQRFDLACQYLYTEYLSAEQWFDLILTGQNLNRLDLKLKSELVLWLLDTVLAVDLLMGINTNSGKSLVVAIDVIADASKQQARLNTIQGLREDGQKYCFNGNRNIPKVRKELEIDKHFVILVDHKNLPSLEDFLDGVFAAANRRSNIASIDLRTDWN